MNSYVDIDRLFGTPLSQLPKPKIPFKIKPWHYVAGAIVVCAAGYGLYTIYNDMKSKFRPKSNVFDKDQEDSNIDGTGRKKSMDMFNTRYKNFKPRAGK